MNRDIVVIGASAGGVETLPKLFDALPNDLSASFFVVMHVLASSPSLLPKLIGKSSPFPTQHPNGKTRIRKQNIYIAPPDYHLMIQDGHIELSHGPKENRHRPAIDVLFRTAAHTYGPRVIGIVLTGNLDDGATGLKEIKKQGGIAITQDPDEALYPEMPLNAAAAVKPDFILSVLEIAKKLPHLISHKALGGGMKRTKDKGTKPESSKLISARETERLQGAPSVFVCPECNGPLWEIRNGESTLYRCLVGHSYAPKTLEAAQSEEVERSLWVALRALEERVRLQEELASKAEGARNKLAARSFRDRARVNASHASIVRKMLEKL